MALSQFEILHCCIRADDAQLKGLGFCGVKERGALMTTEHSSTPTMSAFIIGGTGTFSIKSLYFNVEYLAVAKFFSSPSTLDL